LKLNEDLTEAIAMGHDIGHTPFGHAGETVLNEIVPGGFSHCRHSLRVVDVLENGGRGLNLTYEVRDGILKHSKGFGNIIPKDPGERAQTVEGRVVRIADVIAYLSHDLDDAIRSGVIKASLVPDKVKKVLGHSHGSRISAKIKDVITSTRVTDKSMELEISPLMLDTMLELRAFLYDNVYRAPQVHNEFEKARKYLSEVLKKKPDSSRALALMAKVLEKQEDKKSLKTIYRKILSLNPKDETVIYNLGALEYEDGNLKGALPYFKEYVKSHPKDATVHGILFDIYKKEKNLPLAFKEAVILVELTPKESDIYDFIFDYLKQKDAYEKMIPIMQKGLEANPKEIDLREYLASAFLKTGRYDRAVGQMEVILKARPKEIDPLLLDMFETLRAKGAYDKILRIMKKAVKAYPRKIIFREFLVLACLKTGKEDQAASQMEEILKARPKDLDLLLQLARLREKNGDIEGAAKAYKRIIDISPDHDEASEAYLRLRLKGVGGEDD